MTNEQKFRIALASDLLSAMLSALMADLPPKDMTSAEFITGFTKASFLFADELLKQGTAS